MKSVFLRKRMFLYFISIVLFQTSATYAEESKFSISYPNFMAIDKMPTLQKFFKDCYSEIGIKNVVFVELPYNRSNTEFEKNNIDGEAGRTLFAIKSQQNETPYIDVAIVKTLKTYISFKKRNQAKAKKIIQEMKVGPESVALNNGNRTITHRVDFTGSDITYADDIQQISKMLELDRVEFSISHSEISKVNPLIVSEILYEDSIFHTLSKKNKHLVPKLTKAFKKHLTIAKQKKINSEILSAF